MLEQFKQIYYACKISEVLPCVIVKPIKDSIVFIEKFDKDPEELTLLDLLQHKHVLEYDVMDVGENRIVLSCIRTGCVELMWQVPVDLIYQIYTSIKKHDLSSLAIKSMVCIQADEHAGLPILWRGREVGEVGPIEPLPEQVRQEPYSLPQGFHWVTLSCSNVEEIIKYLNIHCHYAISTVGINFMIMHPNTKDGWQFGIRATNGKLVGVVLAYPVCISIGGVSLVCIQPCIRYHPKYHNKGMYYVLIKELTRRVNLYDINHLVLSEYCNNILKPMITTHIWSYSFDHPTSSQLPSCPRTPGWRRMTSEDVPSVLALINKWSSQLEIRQVFNSEDEFAYFLCPSVLNYVVFTYIVENETNNITDLISFRLLGMPHMRMFAYINVVVSTQSPIKQLIIDALVCAKNMGAKELRIPQISIKSDVLLSLQFQYGYILKLVIYNYKHHEVPATNAWYLIL